MSRPTPKTVPPGAPKDTHPLPDAREIAGLMQVRKRLSLMIGPPPETLDYDAPDNSYLLARRHLCRVYNRMTGKLGEKEFWEADLLFWLWNEVA